MPSLPPPLPWKQFAEPDRERDYIVLLTHLPVTRLTALPRFLAFTYKVKRQLDAAPPGLVGYSLLAKPHRSRYWTLTAWQDTAALYAFVREPPHSDAMRELRKALSGFKTTRWTLNGDRLPPRWEDALAHADEQAAQPPA